MLNNCRNSSLFYLILISEIVISVLGVQSSDFAENRFFSVKHVNIPDLIRKVLSHNNWTDNQSCLTELNAIQNGLANDQQWAKRGD